MKIIILLVSFIITRCGSVKPNIISKKPEISKKEPVLFKLLSSDQIEKFNRELDKSSKEDLDAIYEDRTLLMIAVEKGYEAVVKNLIKKGVNVNIYNSELKTALYLAYKSKNENIRDILLNNNAYLFAIFTEELNLKEESEEVNKIIKNYLEFNKKSFELIEALKNGINEEEIRKLINEGANINIKHLVTGKSIIWNEIENNEINQLEKFLSKIDILVKYGFNINVSFKNFYGDTTLLELLIEKLMLENNNEEAIVKLINNPNLNEFSLSCAFYRYLSMSIDSLNEKITEAFLKRDLNLNILIRNRSILESILPYNQKYKNLLLNLLKRENIKIDPNVKVSDSNESLILHTLISLFNNEFNEENIESIKLLIKRWPQLVNEQNSLGNTPLLYLYDRTSEYLFSSYDPTMFEKLIILLDTANNIDFEIKNKEGNSIYDKIVQDLELYYLGEDEHRGNLYKLIKKIHEKKKWNFNFKLNMNVYMKDGRSLSLIEKLLIFIRIPYEESEKQKEERKELKEITIKLINENEIEQENLNISLFNLLNMNFDLEVLEVLIKKKGINLNYKAKEKILLREFINVLRFCYNETEEKEEKLKEIIIKLIRENKIEQQNLNVSLFDAIDSRNLELVKALVEKGASLNYKYSKYQGVIEKTAVEYSDGIKNIHSYLLQKDKNN